jgi:DNA-binding NarL/FixJ family response regulator
VVLLGGDDLAAGDLAPLLRGPVRAILSADASAEELGAALQAVTQGMLVIEPRVAQMLAAAVPVPQSDVDDGTEETLTDREREVLQLVALGLPNKTIATRLSISEHTVKFHVGSILGKLDAGSRTEAVTRAARRGLLTL